MAFEEAESYSKRLLNPPNNPNDECAACGGGTDGSVCLCMRPVHERRAGSVGFEGFYPKTTTPSPPPFPSSPWPSNTCCTEGLEVGVGLGECLPIA